MADSTVNIKVKTTGARQAESSFKKMGASLIGMGLSVGLVTKGLIDLTKRAGMIQGVERAFNRTGISLEKLRKATRGTVTDFELMQKAVQAKNLGVPIEQLATLFKFASIRARETGESVDYLVNSIVTGIGRKSVLILDNLGISAAKVQENFKKTGNFAQAVADIVNEDMAGMDENIGSLADQTSRLSTAWGNAYDSAARFFALLIDDGKKSVRSQAANPINILTSLGNALQSLFNMGIESMAPVTQVLDEVQNVGAVAPQIKEAAAAIDEIAYAMAKLNVVGMEGPDRSIDRMGFGSIALAMEEVKALIPQVFPAMEQATTGLVVQWDMMANQLTDTFSYVFTEALVREQAFGDAMVAGFKSMLERMVAEMMAKAAVFGILNFISGGVFGAGKSALNFITGGIFSHDGGGMSPGHNSGGNSTTNINMPNVAMINDKSIRQIKQAISVYDRRH